MHKSKQPILPNLLLLFGIPDHLWSVHYLHYCSLGACQRFAADISDDQRGDGSVGWASFLGLITQPGWEAWKRVAKRSQEKHSFPLQLSSCVHASSTACTVTSQREEHKKHGCLGNLMANALSKVFCCVEGILGVFCQQLWVAVCMRMRRKLLCETSWSEQMMNELAMNVLPFGTAGSKALHVRFSPPCNSGWTTDK